MQTEKVSHKLLVGVSVRTSFVKEANPLTSEIMKLVGKYFSGQLGDKILNRIKQGVTYCVYSEYENEYKGDYRYFIGEEVSSIDAVCEGFDVLVIPQGDYLKFTAGPGAIPIIVISTWQKIWQLFQKNEHGKRLYKVDYEVYDERARNPQNSIVDIYVGIAN